MSEVTEKDKQELRYKLTMLSQLEDQEEEYRMEKKKYENELQNFRPEISETLEEVGRKRVRFNKTLVSRVPKAQHRKPTLEMTYQAIENMLGKEAREKIVKAIKDERNRQKEQCGKEGTLKIIPTKSLRKTRKDKKPDSEKKRKRTEIVSADHPRKLKYVKRKKNQEEDEESE